ncbi:MAG: TRAP transporter substrate-binding protein [Pigmentiphaga sp.]
MLRLRHLILTGFCAAGIATTVQAETELLVSQWLPASHPVAEVMEEWNKQVADATQGRVTLKNLPQAVTNPPGHYNAVRDGLADVAMTVIGYTPGRFPLSELSELPLMANTAEANSVTLQNIAERVPPMMDEFKDVKVLALFTHGPGVVFNTQKPIRTLDDLQSLKFRVGGGVVNEVSRQLGANTTLKPATESYELVSTGVMDGVWLPSESLVTYNLDKLIKHATTFPGGLYNSAFIVMMNKDRWNALSADDKAAIEPLIGVAYARQLGQAFDRRDQQGIEAARAAGIEIIEASPELMKEVQARIAPIEKKWADTARTKGIQDPEALIREYRAAATK